MGVPGVRGVSGGGFVDSTAGGSAAALIICGESKTVKSAKTSCTA